MPRFTALVDRLPAELPFTAPERMELERGSPLELRMGANESPFGLADGVREAMAAAAEQIAWYGDPESLELRDEIARRHHLRPENVSVGAGIDDLLGLAVRVLLEAGEVGVCAAGTYPMFPFHVAGYGGQLVTVPYRNDLIDLGGLAAAAKQQRARLAYLANPDNPSGSSIPMDTAAAFLDALPPDTVLLLDQAYTELAPPYAARILNVEDGRVIHFRTFSKAYGMAGARIGYALASPAIIAAFDKVRAHFGVNRVAQAGALASLRDDGFLERVRAENAAGLADYAAIAGEVGLETLPSATNFALFDFATAERAVATLDALGERGVFVRKPPVPPLDRCVRVSVGTPEERRRLGEILRQLHSDGVF
ncbi:MAG: aminotransferase class I/II-fold pyridoxal phosphate-dependent enzyme [Acidobacteriota bacterium]